MTNRLERAALRQHLRVSVQCRIILGILDGSPQPLSAQEIYRHAYANRQDVSLTTIRRTLERLTAAGLLQRLRVPGGGTRYKQTGPRQRGLLVDAATGRRLTFHSDGIEGLLEHAVHALGYRLLDYRLELVGLPETGTAPAESVLAVSSRTTRRQQRDS